MNILTILAFLAGACIAIQAAMNAQLGQVFNNSLLATSYAFLASFLLVAGITFYLSFNHQVATSQSLFSDEFTESIKQVPWYLWLSCVFSVIGVASFYFLIPKMGVGNMMSYALTGQILVAMIISHFGLFDSPSKLISATKLMGTVLLILGIILINKE
ncbi:DMT family transporter [Pseudoalteromonas denitrificans]|uniref:Transporter family-2 protein n=1 Tax=Pseudoalteromonas denitrificans DSM 6059 TaxID=1123010 RepID=A0A1I1J0G0_9GAMM|nr:DMT family transporter [Pseudoalteromonas denitrificans]SFC41966.1 transporter family-2 protein [Pseudoalteromonas denitrificans DSM 6059]